MGERAPAGHIVYVVFETQWLTHLGEGADARVPENRFLLVRLTATNGAGEDVSVPDLTLQADNGTTYRELSNGDGVPQWIGYLRSVKPAEDVKGNALFDAPPAHYKLRVSDENRDSSALIDIPLSFGSETPDVPLPGSAKK
jgi:hypothetical protein